MFPGISLQIFMHQEDFWHVYDFETLWPSRYHVYADAGFTAEIALAKGSNGLLLAMDARRLECARPV